MKDLLSLPPAPSFPLDASSYGLCAGDVDGDGRGEVVVLSPRLPTLAVTTWLSFADLALEWGNGPDQVVVAGACAGQVAGGWQLNATDRIRCADVNGDGRAEVLIYQGESGYLGVLSWGANGLACSWGAPVVATMGFVTSASTVLAGDLDGSGAAKVVVFDAQTQSLAVLGWSGAQVAPLWKSSGMLPGGLLLGSSDRLYVAHLMGSGTGQQVLVFSPDEQQLAAASWDGDGLRKLGSAVSVSVPAAQGGASWQLSSDDCFVTGDVDGDGLDEIVVYNPSTAWFGVLTFDGSEFTTRWAAREPFGVLSAGLVGADLADVDGDGRCELTVLSASSGTTQLAAYGWDGYQLTPKAHSSWSGTTAPAAVSSPSGLVAADVDGDGRAELFVVPDTARGPSTPGAPAALVRWDGSQGFLVQSTPVGAIAGLNPTTVAQAPTTAFTQFTGTQADIYAKVGPSFGNPGPADLRTAYTEAEFSGSVGTWATELSNVLAEPSRWPWLSRYPAQDVTSVLSTLHPECAGVNTLIGHYAEVHDRLGQLEQQQLGDLDHCQSVMNKQQIPPTSTSSVRYWLGGLVEGALWAVAAIPDLGAPAMALAALASLSGTLFSFDPSSAGTKEVDYPGLKSDVERQYANADSAREAELGRLASDPIALRVLPPVLRTAWATTDDSASTLIKGAAGPDQIGLYQVILPVVFHVVIWRNAAAPYPYTMQPGDPGQGPPIATPVSLGAPPAAYLTQPGTKGIDVFALCQTTSESQMGWPTSDLTDDLFVNLNLRPPDVYTGGWSLPTVSGSKV